jgi:thymidylate kinase
MRTPATGLIALDGVSGVAVDAAARGLAGARGNRHATISTWDASRIFAELTIAEESGDRPSARTLILLYAADLAFRLRWDVRPALEHGRTVIVAPYVNTAIAFGRAAGLDATALHEVFRFAPEPGESIVIDVKGGSKNSDRAGFVEFASGRILGAKAKASRRELERRIAHTLKTTALHPTHA